MFDQFLLEEAMESQADLPARQASAGDSEDQRLPNYEKLYHVPVFALRELLESHLPCQKLGPLRQAELVAEAERSPSVTAEDVEDLYEKYRYGQQLSFYLYLLPEGLAEPDTALIQDALDEWAASHSPDLAEELISSEGYEAETFPDQITLLDEEELNGIRESRFRYYVAHRFLNADEEPDQVLQTRYGFLWLDLSLGFLAILTRDEQVKDILTLAVANCLQAIPLPVHFTQELLDKHFSIEKVRRVSHYDPGTGVRQSISGNGLWKEFEPEILARERRYSRPSSLYEEQVAEGVVSGLAVTASKGKIYLTRALPTSLVRAWGMHRLPDIVRDVRELRKSQPASFSRSIEEINRMRLPKAGKTAIVTIVEALLQADREELRSVDLNQTALGIYRALKGKYFNPYLRTQCGQCEEMAELCPHCEGQGFDFGEQDVTCKACGATISDGESVVLRCMNGHITSVPRDEAWSIAPNHWLQKRIARAYAEIGQPWSEQSDYFHIEGSTLYRLQRGQVEGGALPQIVQTYINHYWEQVSGQVHTGKGDLVVGGQTPDGDPQGQAVTRQPQKPQSEALFRSYKNLDLRLRGNASLGYTVEADVPGGGSVPPQSLVLPPDGAFLRRLDAVLRQATNAQDMKAVGETLFNAIFPRRILKFWSRTVGGLADETGLRIRLHIDPLELMALPWELIFEEEYVGLRLRFPIVRYLDLPYPPKPLAVEPPLRVLVAVSQPKDLRPFNAGAELANIRAALGQVTQRIKVDVLEVARRDELLTRLRRGYHVLHFVGHGTFEGDEGYLALEDPEGRADLISALLLGQIVADSNLRLAVLNACETATIGPGNAFGGVAHQMVKGGIPAVVAMQLIVADQTVAAFSRQFYGALADGWSVDTAVQEGRRSIMTALGSDWADFVDWAVPTLYMRAPDGMILQMQEQR